MVHYEVDTTAGKVEFDHPNANLSKQEIQDIVSKNHPDSSSYQVPAPIKAAAQAITMPGRGMRGLGVGLEQLALHPSQPGSALQQASDAVQPGFQAGPGQKLGAFAGGFGDPINLAANAVLPGGTLLKSLGSGAALAGGSSLLDQASTGKIDTGQAGMAGGLGALIGGVTHGIAKVPAGFIKNSPAIFEALTKIPRRATEIFRANPGIENEIPKTSDEITAQIEKGAGGVMQAVKDQYASAKAYFKKAASDPKVGANLNAREKALATPIPALKIPQAIDNIKMLVPRASALGQDARSSIFKTLLHIRQSIDHHVDYQPKSGVPEISSTQAGGLKELRGEVNQMIEQIPGGEIIRDADKRMAATKEIYGKLQPMMKRPGDAIEFLRKTFEGESPNAKEDMMSLLALEKETGKPVVNDMFKALTYSHFSQALAGNKFTRTIAGISPFILSALGRVAGLPFQASMLGSLGLATATQSPKLLGKALRAAQASAPAMEKAAGPTAVGMLNTIRQRYKK